ncbi:MAG: FliI/YscN family ATPase [Phycisphaera sp.]|nr:MAG: FliI/YscN family ATPase [Phycisphaera sp.]
MSALGDQVRLVESIQPVGVAGRVVALRGLTVLVDQLPLPVGSEIIVDSTSVSGEIVGFSEGHAIVMLFGSAVGIKPGDVVRGAHAAQVAPISDLLLGRVIDALGAPSDECGVVGDTVLRPINAKPIAPMQRSRIDRPIWTGVRAIDLMTTLGRGQRMGVFAGPGVGKSTLLGTIARRSSADVNVIALIGERGREVREFIEHSLGDEGLTRSVVVVATGDEPPLMRIRAARLACAVAEHFRDAGKDVLLMMDSVTRFAHAQRQVGLSIGEPPATKGYTPSVFAELPVLLERAGGTDQSGGSVTGLYTVLVEGDDMTEPVADAARGILDGHIVLSRKLAQRSRYPAIDILDSLSRVANDIVDDHHRVARDHLRKLEAAYANIEELVQIGAYAKGSDPESDVAVMYHDRIEDLVRQAVDDATSPEQAREWMLRLAMESSEQLRVLRAGGQPQHTGRGD